MSSLLSTLLIELGFRQPHPPSRPASPRPHVTNDLTDPPSSTPQKNSSSSETEEKQIPQPSQDCPGRESRIGDARCLHGSAFLPALPKDMDGRNLEQGSTGRPRVIPAATGNPGGTRGDSHMTIDPSSEQPRAAHPSESAQNGTSGPIPLPGSESVSGNDVMLDEMGQLSLPADDGMGTLRKKIHAIRDLELSNPEKARMVHDLMTENYNSSRETFPTHSVLLSPPPSPAKPERPNASTIRWSWQSLDPNSTTPTGTESVLESPFSLTAEDLQPTLAPKAEPESPAGETGEACPEDDTEELEDACLGCPHYKRNVKLQCFTCKKWYTCRFCHDEVEEHHLIRRETENMLCMLCGHAQPAAQNCRKCGEQTAQYYCDICKLWDNDSKKSIYHCSDCGICRIGQGLGKDFFHCKRCCVCLPISIETTHRCIERSTQCDCPICGDYMFTSPETVVVMRCGHSIHSKCLSEYSKSSFRCPICSKTITNMESTFRNLDRTIEGQPMPVEFKDTRSLIYCNDCGVKSVVKYHWLGLKCDLCESYNTAQHRLLQGDMSESTEEEEGIGSLPPRTRASSFNANDESVSSSLAALRLNATSVPSSHLGPRLSAGPDGQFSSYSITRDRAISPVVTNYFGLPSERESEKPSSLPFFGGLSRTASENDYGALNFLSKKLRYRYGFLGGESQPADEKSEKSATDGEEDGSESSDVGSDGSRDDDDEEDQDDEDEIDIFGHR
ncbi:hypothetical protein N7474_010180 [Penicillium riverlandense]|uniref:uncharacterized protein n=1 Tax=Penicillium riverlandense TaxID=1903569 RepID=UPI0025470B33|nr:uncharacterized protein N7474_010180 [Penicillium riverlandense]KAJ5808911.1 hypothetical protein N7474_010180 [Penicillium riverlandense]